MWCFGFQVEGLDFWVPGSRLRVSGVVLRDEGWGGMHLRVHAHAKAEVEARGGVHF